MKKLRLDFNLEKSTSAEIFWQPIFKWLTKLSSVDERQKLMAAAVSGLFFIIQNKQQTEV